MKTRILALAVMFIAFTSATVFASEPVPAPKSVSTSVANMIYDNLEYPEFAIEDKFQGKVIMEIKIKEDGSFSVVNANSIDNRMKEHAVKNVEDIETTKYAKNAGQTVIVKVNYDLELY